MGEVAKPDCARCAMEPEFKEIWGCEAETALAPIKYEVHGVEHETRRCPIALLKGTNIHEVMDAYWWLEKGIPPVSGGSEAQSNTFTEAVAIIRAKVDEHQRNQADNDKHG